MVTLGDIDPGFGPGDDRRHWPASAGGRMRDSLFWELIMPEEKLGLQIYLYLSDRGRAGYNVSVWGPGEPLTPTGAMGTAVLEPGYPSRDELAQWKLAVLYEYGRRRAAAGPGDRYYEDPALIRSFLDAAHRNAGLALLDPLVSGSGRRRSPGRASR